MILYLFILVVFTVLALKNWSKAVLLWMPFQILINAGVCLKYSSPSVSLVLAVDTMFLMLYLIRKPKNVNRQGSYFFNTAFKIYLVSYAVSILFSILPFTQVLTGTIKYFIETFIMVYLFQLAVRSMEDIRTVIKYAFIVSIIIVSLGAYESITHSNPWLDYVWLNTPDKTLLEGKIYYTPLDLKIDPESGIRYGLLRCYSTFGIHIDFGCACVLLMLLFLFVLKYKNILKIKSSHAFIICGALAVGVLLSNSKTPIIGLLLFPLAAIGPKVLFKARYFFLIIAALVVVFVFMPEYLTIVQSLFDNKLAEEAGGSSLKLREKQLEVGLQMFYQNPLFGNGIDSLSVLGQKGIGKNILGAESSWLKILPERGLLGVIAYLILYFEMFSKLRRYYDLRFVTLFLLGLGLMETATGFMSFSLYGMIVVLLYRFAQFKQSQLGYLPNKRLNSNLKSNSSYE